MPSNLVLVSYRTQPNPLFKLNSSSVRPHGNATTEAGKLKSVQDRLQLYVTEHADLPYSGTLHSALLSCITISDRGEVTSSLARFVFRPPESNRPPIAVAIHNWLKSAKLFNTAAGPGENVLPDTVYFAGFDIATFFYILGTDCSMIYRPPATSPATESETLVSWALPLTLWRAPTANKQILDMGSLLLPDGSSGISKYMSLADAIRFRGIPLADGWVPGVDQEADYVVLVELAHQFGLLPPPSDENAKA